MRWKYDCCFCGRTVIGLYGQDGGLPFSYLDKDGADADIVQAGLGGSCHFLCLAESAVAERWRDRFEAAWSQYTEREYFRAGPAGFAYWVPHLKEYWLLGTDGWNARIDLHSFRTATKEGDRYRLRIRHWMGITGSVKLRNWLSPYLAEGVESVPVLRVVADTGVKDRLYCPSALRDGYIDLTRFSAEAEAEHRPARRTKKKKRDEVYAHYDIVVSADLYELAWSIFKNRPPVVRRS